MSYFRSYDSLRLFVIVSRHQSFTAAGEELNLTKGAVSYQIKQLEKECGFKLFDRLHNRIELTEKGRKLLPLVQSAFRDIEEEIGRLRNQESPSIVIGASTYFASRWLAPRLMTFIAEHPYVRLRIQPVVGLGDLQAEQLDMMIRWGAGGWTDGVVEHLFQAPAIATAGGATYQAIQQFGLEEVLPTLTLLHDREGSTAWEEWFDASGHPFRPKEDPLVIPDPNVRVEAVISGHGIALNDWLIQGEIEHGRLFQISPITLESYGYHLVYNDRALANPALKAFQNWILEEQAL